MAATGHSIDLYQNWDSTPVTILLAVAGGGALGLMLLNTLFLVYKLYKLRVYGELISRSLFCEDIIFGVSRLVLDYEVTEDEQGNKIAILHGRKAPIAVINFFFPAGIFVFVCACTTFWNVFLVAESFGCDPGLDCFPLQENDSEPLSHTPIQNCSDYDYDLNDNITIVCYKFVFEYAEGIGAAGGILAFAVFIMKIYETVLFWAVDSPVTKSCCGSFKSIIQTFLVYFISLSPGLLSVVMIIIFSSVPLITDTITKSFTRSLQFFAYYSTFTYVASFGVLGLITIARLDKSTRQEDPTENSPLLRDGVIS